MENNAKNIQEPIDVVIAWVDGNDPKHMAKRNEVLNRSRAVPIAGAHPTRFASVNEIKYCLLSIFRFAPFVRNVFIVTDEQDPHVMEDVRKYYPHRVSSIRIVDHKEIFEGYEQYLPTFNSICIANMIWRIKGISNRFVYFNDDVFLVRDVTPDDFFKGNLPVLRGRWTPAPYHRISWSWTHTRVVKLLTQKRHYTPKASFHLGQWNSARILGYKLKYFTNSHTPHSVERGVVEHFFEKNSALLEKNISFQFRERSQFTFISLSNHLQLTGGNRHVAKPNLIYMQPHNRYRGYIDKKLRICERKSSVKFLCVQSLDLCSVEDQGKVLNWLEQILLS